MVNNGNNIGIIELVKSKIFLGFVYYIFYSTYNIKQLNDILNNIYTFFFDPIINLKMYNIQ